MTHHAAYKSMQIMTCYVELNKPTELSKPTFVSLQ